MNTSPKAVRFDDHALWVSLSDKLIVREVLQGWHTHIGHAEDGSVVEIVLLDSRKKGLLPVDFRKSA